MAKEWILNIATNKWGLDKKESVGPVSEWIRECAPKTLEEWREFYLKKLEEFLFRKGINISPSEYLEDLGRKLYTKITEVIRAEIDEVSEEDCINYIYNLVINRTFEGYQTEVETIYKLLQRELGVEIKPAPDEWDRLYNVDFYIEVSGKYIGIQIKPITYNQAPEIHKWKELLSETHEKFEKEYGGKVFIVFSVIKENRKEIYNKEVVEEIRKEINRLKKL
ncbi:MAG: MjaI family restriction endonuclease [Candidatus Hydrothermia bacterium]|nr:MjaI family restriction endonuclease [Candidatus Hydrothermia bacterium]